MCLGTGGLLWYRHPSYDWVIRVPPPDIYTHNVFADNSIYYIAYFFVTDVVDHMPGFQTISCMGRCGNWLAPCMHDPADVAPCPRSVWTVIDAHIVAFYPTREMEVTRQEQRGVGREAGREEEEEGRGDSRGKQKGQRKEETDGPQKATRRGERGGGTRM